MNNQKKSREKSGLAKFLSRRKFRYGGYAIALTAVVIAVIILINVAIGAIEKNWALSIDLTAINVTDFSEETDRVVSGLEEDVHIYTLFQDGTNATSRVQVDEVLNKYHAMNNRISVSNIDPVKEPAKVNKFAGDANLSTGAVIVTNADETRVKLINRSDYVYQQQSQLTNQTYAIFDLESKVTGALVYVSSAETPRVFFLSGHSELDSDTYLTVLSRQLGNQNYDVSKLNLTENADVELHKGDTVVVVNPQRDLSDAEYDTMRGWLADGGRMMFVLDYQTDASVLENFGKLLSYYQLSFGDGVIMEDASSSSNFYGDRYTLVPTLDAEHEITKTLADNKAYLMLPYARPVNPVTMPESGLQFTNLLTTSGKAVVVDGDETGLPGTQTLAMSMLKADYDDPTNDIRIVLLGDLYALADTNLLNSSYNIVFTMNAFNWLVNRQSSVSVSGKLLANTYLAIPDQTTANVLFWVIVVAIPLVVLAAGIVVWVRRRRL